MSKKPLRWGILGTGWIASRFVADLSSCDDHVVFAVGSRTKEKAQEFAKANGIALAHGSYHDLVKDPNVDVIYVASPHTSHGEHTCLALEAGKHVLVEKPFSMDALEAKSMVALAKEKGLFLMEAMWTRFLPHIKRMQEIIASRDLGDIISIHADHGQWFEPNPRHRLFAPELGGGALLDLGIYPVSFAHMVLGKPDKVLAVSTPTSTGVDAQTSVILHYQGGAHAVLNTSLLGASPNRASIIGTKARIEIDRNFFAPTSFTMVHRDGTTLESWNKPYPGHGLKEQALELGLCLSKGLTESTLLPLHETIAIMETMDKIRNQIGLVYR